MLQGSVCVYVPQTLLAEVFSCCSPLPLIQTHQKKAPYRAIFTVVYENHPAPSWSHLKRWTSGYIIHVVIL